ncbi:hypothetical protein QY049_26530 [Bradyrhizobium sp. WYCCWR 13022]|uniref:hypothetical protein n=1 Tax=unclassified Bradyrhizobium TaxID=2631580 RepID=UPI00263B89B2|nr:hypothetical protein [Bradyrhizobium sp. WYCCWR 13022]MDN4986721.1 hypothetical protein [Bradyrhizobium sp. WYCCWR 13022]
MPGWYCIVILSAIGGQGKSLFSELVALIWRSLGCQVRVFSADVQQRLATKLGSCVTTIDTDLLDAPDDPLALLRAFSPLSLAIDQAAKSGSSIVLDTAATWDKPVVRFLRDMGLDKVVAEGGGQMIVALVTTSNRDAMRALATTTGVVRAALPLARPVWVLNERVGTVFPADFDPGIIGLEPEQFDEMRAGVSEIVLPRLDDRLWQPVDRAGLNLVDFVTADPAKLAVLWGDAAGRPLDRLSAAAVQRRIASWIANMMEEATRTLRFPRAD